MKDDTDWPYEIKNRKKQTSKEKVRSTRTSFIAGATAGFVVDVALFPLDTLKTRLQSQYGLWKSGGFKGIYKGVGPTAIGSAPCAAVFFTTYNAFKYGCQPYVAPKHEFTLQMVAAALGETISCTVRVPTDIIKQRRQAHVNAGSSLKILTRVLKSEGIRGLYNGFWTTVLRDAPFSVIQYPLWEYCKKHFRNMREGREPSPLEGALCGAVAGTVAGAATTPLDVVKTRIMLDMGYGKERRVRVSPIVAKIYRQRGVIGFFAGFLPRVVWIFLGGAVFFGVYEQTCVLVDGE